ncbi:MAG: choice-of-anchor tandem repeat GloVer-containing protein [Terriglobales bacterium]
MDSTGTHHGPWGHGNTSDSEPNFGSTKLAAAIGCAILILVVVAVILFSAVPAQGQTEKVLYNFGGGSDGGFPYSRPTFDGAGNLYGTTFGGGVGPNGTVFELSPNGSGGWNETVLYSFTGGADGAHPSCAYVIFDSAGNLYGTASGGGSNGMGVVFELSPGGTGWTETVLHNFTGWPDTDTPVNGLIMDSAGNLYGAAVGGGGSVFELSPSNGGWTEKVIYEAKSNNYGMSGLTMDAAGNIFGVFGTYLESNSTLFELSPDPYDGGWNSTLVHTFTGAPTDGSGARSAPVIDPAGNLYGTTFWGGAKNYGTVYKLSPITTGKKKGEWKEKILYTFNAGKAGTGPNAPFAGLVLDGNGNLYGTTSGGGKRGAGAVFEIVAPVAKGSYKEKVLWSFNGTDGTDPLSSLILDSEGNLYGATFYGGSGGYGVVYELTP